MKTELTGIANTCRATEASAPQLFTIGDRAILAAGKYVDASIFSMFTLPFVQGHAHEAFSKLYSIVLTESTAKKFFGADQNVVGRVIRDLPLNSSLQLEWVAPFDIFFHNNDYIRKWGNNSLPTYVMPNAATNPATVNRQLANDIQKRKPKSNIISSFSG